MSRRRTVLLSGCVATVSALLWVSSQVASSARGRMYSLTDAPPAAVVIVPGARVRDGKPGGFLRGRLDVAVSLVRDGRARAVLVSGDAAGRSGDEITAMIDYLTSHGVDRNRIVADPYGLDTFDTAQRAVRTFGVREANIATQRFHVARAVALCLRAGIDATGVVADGQVRYRSQVRSHLREWVLSRPKAFLELRFPRDPAISTPPDDTLAEILAAH
ncbi:MAG TPA: ElyC/SanA/YdcF family protein [Rhodococcus sp. (in: high G+C Gram-positive bacteria)]|uniref:SanA/YdcF family protein n=1 Tax=Rhodococcus sp. SJ-3 TaxID=3454628 RepID=UPI002DA5FE8D|nr:ElyC/SanA/YdcF family protein [Rhodococcus sp. (in: high G+C Gram-positive bacteria)]